MKVYCYNFGQTLCSRAGESFYSQQLDIAEILRKTFNQERPTEIKSQKPNIPRPRARAGMACKHIMEKVAAKFDLLILYRVAFSLKQIFAPFPTEQTHTNVLKGVCVCCSLAEWRTAGCGSPILPNQVSPFGRQCPPPSVRRRLTFKGACSTQSAVANVSHYFLDCIAASQGVPTRLPIRAITVDVGRSLC